MASVSPLPYRSSLLESSSVSASDAVSVLSESSDESVVVALACLICLILVIDFTVRTVTRANVTYVVSEGTFSTDNNNGIPEATDKPTEAKDNKKDNETVATTKNDDPNYDTITLSGIRASVADHD